MGSATFWADFSQTPLVALLAGLPHTCDDFLNK
jgi:hypothetical protein